LHGYEVRAPHAREDPSYLYSLAQGSVPRPQLNEMNAIRLGKLAYAVLHHVHCPVVIVPE
jgi:nucleotide-binding universal stress UspA family protein